MKVAVLLLDIKKHRILTGIESYYCFEESAIGKNKLLHKWEYCSEEEAVERAKWLSKHFQIKINYSEFENKRTHYCCLTSNSHIGIIKGSVNPKEEPIHAIQREILEEVGIIIPFERFTKSIYSRQRTILYIVSLVQPEVEMISYYCELRDKNHCGELFSISFRTIEEMELFRMPMNNITKISCNLLHHDCNWPNLTQETISLIEKYPISISKIINNDDPSYVDKEYKYSFIKESPFVWNKTRYSLLPLPPVEYLFPDEL